MSSEKFIVGDFIEELCERARYGLRGEKPLAMIAVLQYVYDYKVLGKSLLELFKHSEHTEKIKIRFMDLAKEYGRIKEPSTSWNVITGKNRELHNAIVKFRNVNESFSKLNLGEVKSLLENYLSRLKRTTKPIPIVKVETISHEPLRYSFREADKVLGSLTEEIIRAIRESPYYSHSNVVDSFARLCWKTEVSLLGQYRCDAVKERVVIEVEATDKSSVIDTLHRDLFRFIILYRMGKIKAGVIITRASGGEVNFHKIINELKLYGDHYEVPLYILGLSPK